MSAGTLRVLVVSAQFPYPATSGFARRVLGLTRQLAARHDVTLLSVAPPGHDEHVARLRQEFDVRVVEQGARSVRAKRSRQLRSLASLEPYHAATLRSPALQSALDQLHAERRFDVVQLESSLLCSLTVPEGPALVLDEHNVEYEVFQRVQDIERSPSRRLFNQLEHLRTRRFEQQAWRRAAACAVTSDRELVILAEHAPETPAAVVPNAADLDFFRPTGVEPEPATVVFNGVLDYRPNLDAAHQLVEEIWPLVVARCPQAQLTIVGRGPESDLAPLRRPNVTVPGPVPDIRTELGRAAVVVVPVRMGGGTRLKVLEALAMGKALVSTTLGCEGVNVTNGEHLLIADAPEAFAGAVVDLFADGAARARLGAAGRARMEAEYSWDIAGARLEELYRRVVRAGAVPGPVE